MFQLVLALCGLALAATVLVWGIGSVDPDRFAAPSEAVVVRTWAGTLHAAWTNHSLTFGRPPADVAELVRVGLVPAMPPATAAWSFGPRGTVRVTGLSSATCEALPGCSGGAYEGDGL